jgi:hypothetical protein
MRGGRKRGRKEGVTIFFSTPGQSQPRKTTVAGGDDFDEGVIRTLTISMLQRNRD